MASSDKITTDVAKGLRFKYSGVADWNSGYKSLADWLSEHKYDHFEKKFKHKSGTVFGKQEEIEWEAEREVTPYAKFKINVHFWIDGLEDVQIKSQDNKIKKLQKLRVKAEFSSSIEQDYSVLYGKDFFSNMKKSILQFLFNREIDNKYFGMLNNETHEFMNVLKRSFNMENENV